MANGMKTLINHEIAHVEKMKNQDYREGYLAGLKYAEEIYSTKMREYTRERERIKSIGEAMRETT
jgi:hypothetical protein